MSSPILDLGPDFFKQFEDIESNDERVLAYACTFVNLSALNYPDLIPTVWEHVQGQLFDRLTYDEQFQAARKFREALIKSCGIVGAAKTGTAMRTLCKLIPKDLRDSKTPRANEDPELASKRGHEFWARIYARNPEFDPNATVEASPDYAYVVRDLLYGRIFSYDGILDDLETGYVIVSALIGNDSQNQLRHHMKGMLYNGAKREELKRLQDFGLDLAKRVGVKFRSEPREIPSIEE